MAAVKERLQGHQPCSELIRVFIWTVADRLSETTGGLSVSNHWCDLSCFPLFACIKDDISEMCYNGNSRQTKTEAEAGSTEEREIQPCYREMLPTVRLVS